MRESEGGSHKTSGESEVMPRVLRKPLARADLLDIWNCVADDRPAKADRFLDSINKHCQTLDSSYRGTQRGVFSHNNSVTVGR
jgi:plasmid stabilization system protein ParE